MRYECPNCGKPLDGKPDEDCFNCQEEDWREYLRELGFGNQAVIVGSKRRELFDEIDKLLVAQQKRIISIVKSVENKKFPRGERKWCVECARRIRKDILKDMEMI